MVGNDISFADPLIHKVECCEQEKRRHATSIHHSNVNNVQNVRLLRMDQVRPTIPQLFKLGNGSLLRLVRVCTVHPPHQFGHVYSGHKTYIGHYRVDCHCLNNHFANICIPLRLVVSKIPGTEEFGHRVWLELGHISIYEGEKEASIEELGIEHPISD